MAREVRVAILGDSRDFSRAVNSSIGDTRRLDGAFSGIGRTAGRMGKAIAVGLGGLAVGGGLLAKGFIDAAVESEKVTRQTTAVIKSMGGASKVTAKQVADLSTKLSLQTGIDDELVQSGSNILLTFGKVRNEIGKGNKIFDRATEAALNMSVALGTDMKSASMLVGKALNDPIRGLTALRRSGIQFTKQQEAQIKWMVASGDQLGAQKILLEELDKQFGGSAAAQATAGDKLKVVWGNLQEQLGARLLPVFEKVANWLSRVLPPALDLATGVAKQLLAIFKDRDFTGGPLAEDSTIVDWAFKIRDAFFVAKDAIGGFISNTLEALKGWWDDNGENIKTVAGNIGSAIADAFGVAQDAWENILKPAFDAITDWFTSSPGRMQTVAGAVGLVAGAFTAMAIAALVAQAATVLPFIAIAAGLAAVIGLSNHLIERWDLMRKAGDVFQWVVDHGLGTMLSYVEALVTQLGEAVELMKQLNPFSAGGLIKGGGIDPGQFEQPLKAKSKGSTGGGWGFSEMAAGSGITINVNGAMDRATLADLVHEQRKLQMEMAG